MFYTFLNYKYIEELDFIRVILEIKSLIRSSFYNGIRYVTARRLLPHVVLQYNVDLITDYFFMLRSLSFFFSQKPPIASGEIIIAEIRLRSFFTEEEYESI